MASSGQSHRAEQHRSARRGVEAITVASTRHFPRHAHDEYGLGLMAFGAHRTWSRIGAVEAQAGDVITLNPGEMHDGLPVDGRPRGWRMLYFDPAVVAAEVDEEIAGQAEIANPALRDAAVHRGVERVFAQVTAEAPDELALEEDILRTLLLVFRRHGVRRPPPIGSTPSVARALRRLDDALETPVTLTELAALSGVSRFQLLRGFAREVGTTPYAYLLQSRVRTAQRLLSAGRAPAAAAAEAGFADQSHMTRAFVRQFGVTPARYRAAVA